jgi:hypothetical protein
MANSQIRVANGSNQFLTIRHSLVVCCSFLPPLRSCWCCLLLDCSIVLSFSLHSPLTRLCLALEYSHLLPRLVLLLVVVIPCVSSVVVRRYLWCWC